MRLLKSLLLFGLVFSSCSKPPEKAAQANSGSPPSVIDTEDFRTHVKNLASDQMEGRAPGSKGEELATAYIGDYFKSIGLKTQMQPVPLVGVTSTTSGLKLTGAKAATLKYGDDFVAWTKQQKNSVSVNTDLVFAGYGVIAPEYDWNDFKD